jgi:predicted transcriptional regulator
MTGRSRSFNAYIAEQMKDINFARETLITSIEHFNESVEDALKYTIEQMGIKEFSELAKIPIQNVSEFLRGKRKLKVETLDKYLAVFNLKSKIIVTKENDVA